MTFASGPSIEVTVLLFAAYREALGERRLSVQVPEGTTVSDLYARLAKEAPQLSELRPYTTFAVNRQVTSPCDVVHDQDEIAFLQPASGGCHD